MKSWKAWEAEGTAKTNSKLQRHGWLARLEPSGGLETEASLGLLVTQSFLCSPRTEGSLVPALAQRDLGPLLPRHPTLLLLLKGLFPSLTQRSLWVKPSQILLITVRVLSLSPSVPQGMCVWGWCWCVIVVCGHVCGMCGVCVACVWHVYQCTGYVCVWCGCVCGMYGVCLLCVWFVMCVCVVCVWCVCVACHICTVCVVCMCEVCVCVWYVVVCGMCMGGVRVVCDMCVCAVRVHICICVCCSSAHPAPQ